MRKALMISGIAVLALGVIGMTFMKAQDPDIKPLVDSTDKAVAEVLSDRGIKDANTVSRYEEFWKKGNKVGKTVAYVFDAPEGFATQDMEKAFRQAVKNIKDVRLDKPEHKKAKDNKQTLVYVFRLDGEIILSVTIRNIPPERSEAVPAEKSKAKDTAAAQPASDVKPGMVAIVLDDCGYTNKNLAKIKAAGVPLSMAILPNAPSAKAANDFAKTNGIEVLVHLPMEPKSDKEKLEKDTIKVSMKESEIRDIVDRALELVPAAKGVNNHMGSKATEDEAVMKVLFGELKKRDMYFLDSMTTDKPVSDAVSGEFGVAMAKRDIFIDHMNDEQHITAQMAKIEKFALSGKDVIAIGHDRPLTVKVLDESVPAMKKKGIRFVFVSDIIKAEKR